MKESLPQAPLDLERLSDLFHAELVDFRAGMQTHPIPEIQDLRAGALGWIARFAPESVRNADRDLLNKTREAVREWPDFSTRGWYRIPHLDAAQYALHGDRAVLGVIISNLDHHKWALRSSLHAPLGLVIDRLSIQDEELVRRIGSSLSKGHLDNESLLCLFIAAGGEQTRKIDLARNWRDSLKLAPQDAERLDALLSERVVSNAMIFDEYSQIVRYLFCRLLEAGSPKHGAASQLEIEGVPPGASSHRKTPAQLDMPGTEQPDSFTLDILWQRMNEHPLMRAHVQFKPASRVDRGDHTPGESP